MQENPTLKKHFRCVNGSSFSKRHELLIEICKRKNGSVVCDYSCYVFRKTEDKKGPTHIAIQRKDDGETIFYKFRPKKLTNQHTLEDFEFPGSVS